MSREIFCFGSNLRGIHGAGSAKAAYQDYGAVWGCGIGLQGDSYAIPTKDEFLDRLPLKCIGIHIENFLDFAAENSEMIFNIVAIGCGLAGFTAHQIAPMFKSAPANCILPMEFLQYLNETKNDSQNQNS